ncbi:tRNA (N(6)-L-threonylcarbamoyladenosine(37)-C(2))-methylthiotransferase MtaB [Thalassobaculum fulvum]|uniref:tRNA (N(6)-L-threonylcarbamoyladenosine(37)-C(2))-methylthiotransferase MtaB n=1 Tax=Thalassobaculum fulvum TaxID=1633335 RepID=A0A919CNY2_9PROT|nr:tRNA (N(6)-L-threonylcarbamoyladenosine(37)-C(2))-methylthiotransferase MtaB [Thalassobaculum fulvum]GHD40102.1 tRNA (N(6)-L-threonylcarbamoyladenosine(37)-C(2))-methylthiotransferase MtaB [Thalassobaculum fulvum]
MTPAADHDSPAQAPGTNRVETFGCRLNAYESEVIRGHLDAAGKSGAIVVNTCAVTAEAERQARQAIRRLVRENPGAEIVVTGCAAQIDPARYAAIEGVARVIGNEEKMRAETWAQVDAPAIHVTDIMQVRETAAHLVSEFDGRARAFVQVQQGCDHRCTFCIIPFGRGNSRSVPIGAIVEQVRTLVAAGYREVVLTGVDVTSFGGDLPGRPTLGQMIRRLLALVPELERLRLSSVDPVEIDDDLFRLIADEERLMPHLHLSLQAGDDMVLKRMKRRHLRDDVVRLVEKVCALRPDTAFGADVIAGFPTESDAMFENTAALLAGLGIQHLHVFPYSPRPGTPAARMPQVPADIRKARAARLRAIGAANLDAWLAGRVGLRDRVLIEADDAGRGESFAPIALEPGHSAEPGAVVPVTILGVEAGRLIGRPLLRAAA